MSRLKPAFFKLALLTLLTSAAAQADTNAPVSNTSFDFGPIASRQRDVNGDYRLKAIGPFYEYAHATNGMRLTAVRPLFSTAADPARDREMADYLWPLGMSRTLRDENQWRYLIFYGFNHTTNDPGKRYRTWIIPFYFQGRDASGKTYRALFPLGGTIKDFLGRDKMSFVLWPIYSTSAINDISTVNYLWPFISETTSKREHIYRARFFPFYGVNKHKGKYDKRYILWPFYTEVDYHYKHSKGHGFILFPLYGRLNLTSEKTTWILPPFFRFTDGKDGKVTLAPWPFYQHVVTKEVDKKYVWPIWGRKKIGDRTSRFYLWPLVWSIEYPQTKVILHNSIFAPIYNHTTVRTRTANPVDSKLLVNNYKVWPFYSYRRSGDKSIFRFVELWPFESTPSVVRNWSPIWSLYTRTKSGGNVDNEVLWGLYRDMRRSDSYHYRSLFPIFDYKRDDSLEQPQHSWNILKGLIGFERKGSRKTIRLLYIIKL